MRVRFASLFFVLLLEAVSQLAAQGNRESAVLDKMEQGEYADAWEYYGENSRGTGRDLYNQGLAALGTGRFEESQQLFSQAVEKLDGKEAARGYYNWGVSELQQADSLLRARAEGLAAQDTESQADPAALLANSLDHFRRAWKMDSGLDDAVGNAEYAADLLAQLQAREPPSSDESGESGESGENTASGSEGASGDSGDSLQDMMDRQQDLNERTASKEPPQASEQQQLADQSREMAENRSGEARENLEQAAEAQARAAAELAAGDTETAGEAQQEAMEALSAALAQEGDPSRESPDRSEAGDILKEEQKNREERDQRNTVNTRGGITDVDRNW